MKVVTFLILSAMRSNTGSHWRDDPAVGVIATADLHTVEYIHVYSSAECARTGTLPRYMYMYVYTSMTAGTHETCASQRFRPFNTYEQN